MRSLYLWLVLAVLLPITSAFITYTLVAGNMDSLLNLDAAQGALLSLALLKFVMLGSLGVFPIDLDDIFARVYGKDDYGSYGRYPRDLRNNSIATHDEPLSVKSLPCTRRFLCELETAVRTSDSYNPQPSQNMEDRHPEEEIDVEPTDPLTELYIEAIRAMYGHDGKKITSEAEEKKANEALEAMHSLTGKSCEEAYQLCKGRFTGALFMKKIFEETNFRVRDEL